MGCQFVLTFLLALVLLFNFNNGIRPEFQSLDNQNQSDSTSRYVQLLQTPKRSHFVLVHGAAHGAWCWYKVSSILKSAGHRVTALDMKASGANPTDLDTVTSLVDYSTPLLDFMESLTPEEKIVLVGHSFGGYSISVAMELYPSKISVSVFLAAAMLSPSSWSHHSLEKSMQKSLKIVNRQITEFHWPQPTVDYYYGNGVNNPPTAFRYTPEYYKLVYYRLSPAEDYELGMTLWSYFPYTANDRKGVTLTEKSYGGVRRVYLICDPETAMDWQIGFINGYPPEEVVTLLGSDHMSMFSQTEALVATLESIGSKYHHEVGESYTNL